MAVLATKALIIAKKITYSGTRPDARDYYWFKSPTELSWLVSLRPLDPHIVMLC